MAPVAVSENYNECQTKQCKKPDEHVTMLSGTNCGLPIVSSVTFVRVEALSSMDERALAFLRPETQLVSTDLQFAPLIVDELIDRAGSQLRRWRRASLFHKKRLSHCSYLGRVRNGGYIGTALSTSNIVTSREPSGGITSLAP